MQKHFRENLKKLTKHKNRSAKYEELKVLLISSFKVSQQCKNLRSTIIINNNNNCDQQYTKHIYILNIF